MLIRAERRPRPPLVGLVLAVCLVVRLGLALGLPSPAAAQGVPHLDTAITDQTGVLATDRAAIEDALQRLFEKTGVQLYVLFINTTGQTDIAQYAAEVSDSSQLGAKDALLVVALQDRSDNLSFGSDLRDSVSQTALDRVRNDVLEPALTHGDFGAAVIGTSDALGNVFPAVGGPTAVLPTAAPVATPASGGAGSNIGNDAGSALLVIFAVVLIMVGLLLLVGRVVRLRAERRAKFEEAKKIFEAS